MANIKMIDEFDLTHIANHVDFSELKNKKIFITGGTGFFGKWMLESLLFANDLHKLNVKATVLTRNPSRFNAEFPLLASRVQLQEGDVRTFNLSQEKYDYLLHMATDENHRLTVQDPQSMFDIIANGTRHALGFAYINDVKKVLFTSSGVVLSKEVNVYKEGKKKAEEMCDTYKDSGMEVKIARVFCSVGAYLPLNKHFAIGNFINDVLHGNAIQVKSDGKSVRSYLYMADTAIWLWNILFKGEPFHRYNVGSDKSIDMLGLANVVAQSVKPPVGVNVIGGKSDSMPRYVPLLTKEKTLGLKQYIDLSDAIQRTIKWNRRNNGNA